MKVFFPDEGEVFWCWRQGLIVGVSVVFWALIEYAVHAWVAVEGGSCLFLVVVFWSGLDEDSCFCDSSAEPCGVCGVEDSYVHDAVGVVFGLVEGVSVVSDCFEFYSCFFGDFFCELLEDYLEGGGWFW